jgi:hypothetical protein
MFRIPNVIWDIHSEGPAVRILFMTEKCAAIGWQKIGDLSKIKSDWEAIKANWARPEMVCSPKTGPFKMSEFC